LPPVGRTPPQHLPLHPSIVNLSDDATVVCGAYAIVANWPPLHGCTTAESARTPFCRSNRSVTADATARSHGRARCGRHRRPLERGGPARRAGLGRVSAAAREGGRNRTLR